MAAGPVLVVDFGAQYAQLIARRVREANVYSELVPHSMPVDEMLAKDPQASSFPVVRLRCSSLARRVWTRNCSRPAFPYWHLLRLPGHGLCLGRECRQGALGEYGKTETFIDKSEGLLDGSPADQNTWMSHGVAVKTAPEGFEVLAHTEARPLPPCRTNPANCTACSGILKSSTPRWASSSSRPSCTSAQGSATTGMPPASSRIRSRRSARRSATHR